MRLIDADALLYDLEVVPLTGDGGVDANDLDDIIKRQPTIDPEPQWIPVTERLPEEDGRYLITGKRGTVYSLEYEANKKRWDGGITPVAWMPLPEPYKEKE